MCDCLEPQSGHVCVVKCSVRLVSPHANYWSINTGLKGAGTFLQGSNIATFLSILSFLSKYLTVSR